MESNEYEEEYEDEEQEEETVNKENLGVKILGGFFVFRANPSESKPLSELLNESGDSNGKEFAQKGEIIGMVLIKKYGTRIFTGFSPIDSKNLHLDKFMTHFSDTALNNPYDNNREHVFDIETLGHLINKMISQPLEQTVGSQT
jgi:hypothetical protein